MSNVKPHFELPYLRLALNTLAASSTKPSYGYLNTLLTPAERSELDKAISKRRRANAISFVEVGPLTAAQDKVWKKVQANFTKALRVTQRKRTKQTKARITAMDALNEALNDADRLGDQDRDLFFGKPGEAGGGPKGYAPEDVVATYRDYRLFQPAPTGDIRRQEYIAAIERAIEAREQSET